MIGVGVETVGTDAGAAHSFDPAFPCHSFLMGSGKYGLTQLQNLASLPPTGRGARRRAAADRHRVGRAGPRGRARRALTVAPTPSRRPWAAPWSRAGIDHVFGVVGSGNFHVTNAMVAAGARFVAARHEGGAATMADAYARTTDRPAAVTVHQGPGLTNAMTGITEAAKSRTPVVVVAAEVTEPRSNFFVDQDVARPGGRSRADPHRRPGDRGPGGRRGRSDRGDHAAYGPAQPPADRPGPRGAKWDFVTPEVGVRRPRGRRRRPTSTRTKSHFGGGAAGRGRTPGRAAGVRRRPRSPGCRRLPCPHAAEIAGRAARRVGGGQGAVRGPPLVARRLRRLRLPRRRRPHRAAPTSSSAGAAP